MSSPRVIARNVLWNWSGMAANMATGFVLMPFLVHRLGDTRYGLWVLIGSLTGYFSYLDLGVRGSLGRYVAFHRARNDQEAVNATLSTALAGFCAAGLIALLGSLAIRVLFFAWFDVPGEYAEA